MPPIADGYRVQPASVHSVLADTATARAAVVKAAIPLGEAFSGAGPAADGTDGADLITAALQALENDVTGGVRAMTNRLSSASHGLGTATEAVTTGDEQMSAEISSQAAAALSRRIALTRAD